MNRVLVVDDKEENLYYLSVLLRSKGYDVVSARHGAEALVLARQHPPNLVISDLLMPVMDGYTLLRRWKADPQLRQSPFVVYTATYTEPRDEKLALDLGADAFILKPAEPEVFLARIEEILTHAATGQLATSEPAVLPEIDLGQQYSEVLIRKLEEKSHQLQEANRALEKDIAQRQKTEEGLRNSEERFRQVVENIQEVFWVTDVDKTQMLYISPGYERIWGLSCESLYRSPRGWIEAVHAEDRERVHRAVTERQAQGDYNEEYRILRPDGTIRCIHERAFGVRDAAGKIYRIAGVAVDITERRHLEDQLRQAQKIEAIGQLAGGVAHDFNNILSAIMMQAELTLSLESLPPEAHEGLLGIKASAERAAALTRQLLLFGRRQVMQPRSLDLNNVVADFARMLQRIVGEDIRLQLSLSSKPLPMHADAGMFDQVLMNLAVNARDAMPKGGHILIETSEIHLTDEQARQDPETSPGHHACLSFSDTGTGITDEVLPHIFEPFFTTKSVGKGTGLGLATVFGIVKQHRGWIRVSSTPGTGTTFRVFVPVADHLAAPAPSKPAPPRPRGGLETLLLVEDEPAVRILTRHVLEGQGYDVLEAATGAEALRVWEQNSGRIRLLLTDLVMPGGMDGRELAAELQVRQPGLKVVFTSGYAADIAGRGCPLREGQNFLQKPPAPDHLLETVRRCLDA